jgi:hypothetical protein
MRDERTDRAFATLRISPFGALPRFRPDRTDQGWRAQALALIRLRQVL